MLSAKHFDCCTPARVYGCTPTCSVTPCTRVCTPAKVYGYTRCGRAHSRCTTATTTTDAVRRRLSACLQSTVHTLPRRR
jgi:hypothetical protein